MARKFFYSNWKKHLGMVLIGLTTSFFSFSQTSIFPATSTPAVPADNDGQPIELGVKFRSSQAGFITGVRFYKGAGTTGTHIGHLWSSTGTKLAEITFTGESASGWQQMLFTSPVAITANTTYVASYFSGDGYYAYTNPYFTTATTNAPLTALANGTDGGNGVYVYAAASAFPNNTFQSANYWVDVLYVTSIGPDLTPPAVSITAPAAGNVSATINVTATATDNIGVTGVQFLLDGANLGTEDLTSPFSISWITTTTTNGNHTLTARARDAAGNTTTSAGVVVNVNNDVTAPTVSITAPAAGTVTSTVSVTATAADNIGVAGVQFLLDGANLGAEDVSSPYSISWNTAAATNGNHTLTARARDAAGNTTTSAAVAVVVDNAADATPPTVSMTAPAAGTVSSTVTVSANASDNVGVAGVQFLLNGVNLGAEDVSSPYSISWNTLTSANGSYTLTARARDFAGNVTTSTGVAVTVNNANTLLAALPMNEGSGTTTADVSGLSHPGTLVNTPTWGAGKYGQGLTLNGTNSYVNIPDHNDFTLDPTQSYTWSLWIKNASFKEWSTVWSQTASNTAFFYFYAHTTTDVDGGPVTNGISVYWWSGNNRVGAHSSNNVLTAGTWSYVTVTYDASQAQNNRFSIYVNGVDVTVRTDVSSSGTLASINPTNIRIGANAPFGEFLSGSVDEVRYYKRLLSAAEIQTDMNTPLAADVIAPAVSLTAPAAGNVSGTINVDATASDNIAVAGVQFLLDGVSLGAEDIVSPYSVSWNTVTATNGNHTLTARARDAAGNTTTSAGVIVTVNNDVTAPTVNLTAPAAGTISGTINVDATASDNIGVAGVQFLLDGINLGAEDITAPYSISWNSTTTTDGNHTLTARARDAAGNSTISAGVIVTVSNDGTAPAVSITAPVAGGVTGTIAVTADATDNIGVAGVQFQLDGVNLGTEDISSPYSISWNSATATNGNHTLTARARDAAGNVTISAGVNVSVNNDTQAPTVSITAPASGQVAGTINVDATASDNTGVVGVQFLLDGINLGTEDLLAPYSISWNTTTIADGNHTLTARARDAAGNTTTSAAVVVNVHNDVTPPTVNITAPASGNVSGTISVTANAADNVTVAGVQFLLDGVNLGTEDVSSPYSVSWNTQTAANGVHTLTARARDASGNTTTSAGVDVNVFNNTMLIAALNLNEGTGVAAADISGNNHNGTLTNTPTWGTGKYSQAVNFNGTSNYINLPAHSDFNLDPAQSYTWSAWVKNTNFAEWGPVWSQTADANNFFYFYAHTTTDADGGPVTNGISVYWWTNGGANKVGVHSSNNVLTAGQWSHVAVTYDATQPQNNRFSIFVNGVDVTVRTDVNSAGTLTAVNATNIRIASDQPFSEFLNGSIDEVRMYKRALSVSEIQTDMNTPIANGIAPSVSPANSATNVSLISSLTSVFNVDMNASTINSTTFELRNSANVLVPATIDYNSSTRTATLTPSSPLQGSSLYFAKIKGGVSGVKDAAGNIMNNDYNWSFTTLDPASLPITEGPGGPILVISSASNAFSRYPVEILRAEGLNEFAAVDISSVTSTMLNNYDVVILGEMTVSASQVTMLTNWVNAGGTLIAFKPSALLMPLMGLNSSTGTLSDKYLLVNTSSGPGVGIVNQTIQYHGPADLHTLNGATSLATLYSTSTAATSNPAVTTNNVGTNGGRAVAFTYDLARSIVYTRQGNPAVAGTETDGQSPVRPDDLFFPGYVDLNKVAIPQADEQQRLLANIIIQANLVKKPLPRFWYLPSGHKAAVIYALDDHGTASATPDIFNKMIANSPAGCSVDNWECLRATSWFYVGIPMTNNQAVNYNAQGFDMGVHVQNGCANFSNFSDLNSSYTAQLQFLANNYPGLPAQTGHRFHCLVWSDWLTQAKVELAHNMRISLDYYYWPPSWINGRPGLFTGSGMPMRFADLDGSMIDVYQGVSQLVNENGINYTTDINTLLDNALGTQGYYGMFGTHDDYRDVTYSDVTIAQAKARNVPVISARQALTWLDGRNNSSFGNMSWSNNQLTFDITARSSANNIRAMLPVNSASGALVSITRNGTSLLFTVQTIKGIDYAFFAPVTGTSTYVATYGSGQRVASPPVTDIMPATTSATMGTNGTAKNLLMADPEITGPGRLTVNILPNPSTNNFTIRISSNDENPVSIRVTDMLGRVIETYEKVTSAGMLKLGQNWTSGVYFAEVMQGEQRKLIKMIKTN
jgi:hypothetical protein